MDVKDIISDALVYPFQNIKALLIYAILGIIVGVLMGGSILGIATGTSNANAFANGALGVLGLLISIVVSLLITGFELDIVNYGINRDSGAPGIDPIRQIVNGIKLVILNIIYYIIPIIILAVLGVIFRSWLTTVIGIILTILFAFAQFMGECRLAKTESLGYGLAIGEAIGDISKVGLFKILAVIIISIIISMIIILIISAIISLNSIIGGILLGIFGVYIVFFTSRIKGLLYSSV